MSTDNKDWQETLSRLNSKNKMNNRLSLGDDLKARLKAMVVDPTPSEAPAATPTKKKNKFFAPSAKPAANNASSESPTNSSTVNNNTNSVNNNTNNGAISSTPSKTKTQFKGKQGLESALSQLSQLKTQIAQEAQQASAELQQVKAQRNQATNPATKKPAANQSKSSAANESAQEYSDKNARVVLANSTPDGVSKLAQLNAQYKQQHAQRKADASVPSKASPTQPAHVQKQHTGKAVAGKAPTQQEQSTPSALAQPAPTNPQGKKSAQRKIAPPLTLEQWRNKHRNFTGIEAWFGLVDVTVGATKQLLRDLWHNLRQSELFLDEKLWSQLTASCGWESFAQVLRQAQSLQQQRQAETLTADATTAVTTTATANATTTEADTQTTADNLASDNLTLAELVQSVGVDALQALVAQQANQLALTYLQLRNGDLEQIKTTQTRLTKLLNTWLNLAHSTQLQAVQRLQAVPSVIEYNEDLPVTQSLDKIRELLLNNQVVVIAGETGSGKTTQIPKLCLELGFAKQGLIGHTQPRRIAATSVAKRIAEELHTELGRLVGYKIRFNDIMSPHTQIKLMTDGIILAELVNDPLLEQYSCLIIDEAHERSLNNDFILGYLKHIHKQRPDLKIIITSATIEVERFSKHFGNCPIIQVEGRTFPVEVRYRPLTLDNFVTNYDSFTEESDEAQTSNLGHSYSFGSTGSTSLASAFKAAGLRSDDVAVAAQTYNTSASSSLNAPATTATRTNTTAAHATSSTTTASNKANLDSTYGLPTSNPYASSSIYDHSYEQKDTVRSQGTQQLKAAENFGLPTENPYAASAVSSSSSRYRPAPPPKPSRFLPQLSEEYTKPQPAPEQETAKASNYHLLTQEDIQAQQDSSYWEQASNNELDQLHSSKKSPSSAQVKQDTKAYHAYLKYADSEDSSLELPQGVIAACEELLLEGRGDILVFLSGEREIRDVTTELTSHFTNVNRRYPGLQILPLYSRLSAAEQQLIFKPNGALRIILATNIAETSITVPGIKYVVDAGTARISRYNHKTQVQGLPIEPISQASANQRKGRCGRTSPGICIRLYSEQDFNSRPEYTDPEILRTNLSSVILKMLSLNLPDIENFPFLDKPNISSIRNGVKLLEQLQALDRDKNNQLSITHLGNQLSQLPLDPRFARMLLAASEIGSLNELLVITSGLTIVDVRENPTGKQMQASQMHAEYKDERSDYMGLLNLWNFLEENRELSNNQFRKLCKRRYLNYLRVREWQDLYSQLRMACLQMHLTFNQVNASYDEVHRAMIPGLLDHIAQYEGGPNNLFKGANNRTFKFFPASALNKKRHSWVIASEIIHLSQTYSLRGAQIEASWIEQLAPHLIKYNYNSPHWSQKRGEVMAYQQVQLFGLTLVEGRLASYGPIDREVSRQIFIRQALVEQHWHAPYKFYTHNNQVIAQALKYEEQQRKRGLLISEQDLYDWYEQRIPSHVYNSVSFKQWYNQLEKQDSKLLYLNLEDLLVEESTQEQSYPELLHDRELSLSLNYVFDLNREDDGVNVVVPLAYLHQLDPRLYQWHIANFRLELIEELIRALPKAARKQLIPAPDYARAFLNRVPHVVYEGKQAVSLYQVLSNVFRSMNGANIDPQLWQEAHATLPAHLKLHFKVMSLEGELLATSDNLAQLQEDLRFSASALVLEDESNKASSEIYSDWDFASLGKPLVQYKSGLRLESFPALVPVNWLKDHLTQTAQKLEAHAQVSPDSLSNKIINMGTRLDATKAQEQRKQGKDGKGESTTRQVSVSDLGMKYHNTQAQALIAQASQLNIDELASGVVVKNFASPAEQEMMMRLGMSDLLLLNCQSPIKYLQEKLRNRAKLALYFSDDVQQLIHQCIKAAASHILEQHWMGASRHALGQQGLTASEPNLANKELVWNEHFYKFLLNKMREELNHTTYRVAQVVEQILVLASQIQEQLARKRANNYPEACDDIGYQVEVLIQPEFIAATPFEQLEQVPRYLQAALYRTGRLGANYNLDQQRQEEVNDLDYEYEQLESTWPSYRDRKPLRQLFFMIQELRVSLFAQTIGARMTVSPKRILSFIEEIKNKHV